MPVHFALPATTQLRTMMQWKTERWNVGVPQEASRKGTYGLYTASALHTSSADRPSRSTWYNPICTFAGEQEVTGLSLTVV
jgi:hypothetical protein